MREDSDLNKDRAAEVQDLYFEKDGDIIKLDDIEPDPEILKLAKEYDKIAALKKRQKRRKDFVCIAALVVICVVTVSAVTIETSDALKLDFFRIFHNEENGAATLVAEDEYDLIGDWEDYWYPTYMPEGYVLTAAEKTEQDSVMLYASEEGEIRIIEQPLDSNVTFDTDHADVEEVRIGYHQGYLVTSEEYDFMSLYWKTDERQIGIVKDGACDKEMLMKIAESMKYKK